MYKMNNYKERVLFMEEINKKKQRILYYDILNILACFCVIWLHTNGTVHKYFPTFSWKTSLIVEVIAYWAVPVFFMLTGATLMDYRKKYDTKTFFKKRIQRAVVPFFVWSLLMLIWGHYTDRISIENITCRNIINILILNQQENTYWFFWAIFSIYLSLPILSLLTEEKNRKILWYIVVVSAIFNSVPLISYLLKIEWNGYFNFPVASGYIMYVVLGYLISTQDMNKRSKFIIYALGILSAIIRYSVTYILSSRDGMINTLLFNYSYITTLFLALSVFVFVKNINFNKIFKNDKVIKSITSISSCSLGIYLIHKIVMAYEIQLFNIDAYSLKWRTIGAVSTYLLCLIVIFVMKKIPIIKKIVP